MAQNAKSAGMSAEARIPADQKKSRSLVRNDIDMSFRPRLRSQDVPRDDMLGGVLIFAKSGHNQ